MMKSRVRVNGEIKNGIHRVQSVRESSPWEVSQSVRNGGLEPT